MVLAVLERRVAARLAMTEAAKANGGCSVPALPTPQRMRQPDTVTSGKGPREFGMDSGGSAAGGVNHFSLPGGGRAEAVLGTSMIYKAEASQTGGRLVCAEITVPPGQGIPPHRHDAEDEAFYVLSGCVAIEGDDCGGGTVSLDAGGFFYGPRGRIHGFRCTGTQTARLLVFVTPGTGIGAMFTELAELTRQQDNGLDPAQVAAVCSRYGIAFASM